VFCPVTPEVAEVPAYKDYRPVDPTPVAMANLYIEDGKIKSVPWSLMTNTQIRSLLPNQKSYVSVAKVDKSGKLSYLTSRSTLEAGRYRLYSDYFKYKVEEMVKDGQVVGSGFVGIGVRLQVDVRTLKADVDLSSVAAVGVAAKEGKLQGDISVSVIGIDTNDADLAFNSGSVDDASIQKALETLGAIKSRMKDVNTILTPQIVYVKDLKDM
jgi:hypothetical protein